MASRQFLDPATLLRVAPLVTSTVALQFSVDQYLFLDNLRAVRVRGQPGAADRAIPSYFRAFFRKGLPLLLGTYSLTIAAGACNAFLLGGSWYKGGTALALAHFAFVPAVMWKVEGLAREDDGENGGDAGAGTEGRASRLLAGWLNVHALRSLTVDLPAWLCFLVAAVKTLREA